MLATESAAGQTCIEAHPETHQNLIHPDKDLASTAEGAVNGLTRPSAEQLVATTRPATIPATPNRLLLRDTASGSFRSNHPNTSPKSPGELVEVIGFEPTTPCLQSRCSPS